MAPSSSISASSRNPARTGTRRPGKNLPMEPLYRAGDNHAGSSPRQRGARFQDDRSNRGSRFRGNDAVVEQMNSSGHFPRQVGIDAYGNGGFRFAEMSHKGSLLCLP